MDSDTDNIKVFPQQGEQPPQEPTMQEHTRRALEIAATFQSIGWRAIEVVSASGDVMIRTRIER